MYTRLSFLLLIVLISASSAFTLELKRPTICPAPGQEEATATAAQVLQEELASRGCRTKTAAVYSESLRSALVLEVNPAADPENAETHWVDPGFRPGAILLGGTSQRALLFAVGYFLRHAEIHGARISFTDAAAQLTPAYPLRGHQIGYRARANSWDSWDAAQMDQHVRELALFGTNAIENIPFQDEDQSPHMPIPRSEMNRHMSEICQRYDLQYWVWTPATFDLKDTQKRQAHLAEHEQLYQDCPRLDGVFFPGGDPGDNHPDDVMPFLADLAPILAKYHPAAKIWISLQGFDEDQVDTFYTWLEANNPDWLGGVVAGPSSPPIDETRERLDPRYAIRHYPDITHTVRCQYPVKWWDPAFALTLGRECINPQPEYYALIHNSYAPDTIGFLTYSDGVHDDVNKIIWSLRGVNPQADVREMLMEYTRFFFGSAPAEAAADGILALEKNWEGPLAGHGGVPATLSHWQGLERGYPGLAGNWRWQMCLIRAYYDAYTRERLIFESALEEEMNARLREAQAWSPELIEEATAILARAQEHPVRPEWRKRIVTLCDDLFHSIGLQTSVPKYQASGYERGASLDFIDYPLNNRWWIEDEFKKIGALADETARIDALHALANWETPGPGGYYDDLGNLAKSPHVIRGENLTTDPLMERDPNPGYWWWENGFSRERLSWQVTMDQLIGLRYDGLDPAASYVLRFTGYGDARPEISGRPLQPRVYGKEIGDVKEFAIPAELVQDGSIVVRFAPLDEGHLNWRQQSRLAEAWLIKESK